jgi:RNA polymerase sigma-70 factor (ECF subfamily)
VSAQSRPRPAAPAPGDLDDAALVARAAAGDRAAFRALYDRHRPAVHRLVRAFATLDPDDADDVVQDAFIRAFSSISKLTQPGRFGAWILTIARNRALSRLGRRRAAEKLSEELTAEAGALAERVAAIPEPGLEAELKVVRKVVAELPEGPEKETVRLFYLQGELSAREIAERLGVGKSAVTMRLERFRAKVKRRILAEVARLRGEGS